MKKKSSSNVDCPWAQLSNCTSIIWYQTDQNLIPIILLSFWHEFLKNLRSNPKRNLTSSDTACVIQKSIDQDVSCQWGCEKSQTVPEVISIKFFPITCKNGVLEIQNCLNWNQKKVSVHLWQYRLWSFQIGVTKLKRF